MEIVVEQRSDGLGVVEINRPHVKNALNQKALINLAEAFEVMERARDVKVISFRGRDGFCAGADLSELVTINGAADRERFFSGFARVIGAMIRCSQPIVGVVKGFGVAGGCGLVAACDLVYAEENAKFAIPEVKLGLAPLIVMAAIQRVIGARKAMALALSAEFISAAEAKSCGLINEVYKADELETAVQGVVEKLLRSSSAALAAIKRASYEISDSSMARMLATLPKEIAVLSISAESEALIKEYLKKGAKS